MVGEYGRKWNGVLLCLSTLLICIMDYISNAATDGSSEDDNQYEMEEYDEDIDGDPDYVPPLSLEHTGSLGSEGYVVFVPSPPMLTEDEISTDGTESVDEGAHAQPIESVQPTGNVHSAVSSNIDKQNIEPPRSTAVAETSFSSSQRGGLSDETCSICFEPWTNSSEHRLVSLRCGHLFGRSCITQWLKGQNARCPQCNARARKSEIRNIYARSIKVIDSSERDKALQDLVNENKLRRAAEMEAAQLRLKYGFVVQDCERLKRELMEAQKQLQEFRSGLNKNMNSQKVSRNPKFFSFIQSIAIYKDKEKGCRVVNSGDLLGMLLVSQPSSNALFPGFGFRKISTIDMRPCDFVLVHKCLIRDMAFHIHDGLVLTASIDKSLKITNVLTNTVVQTYNCDAEVWSCAWDSDNSTYFYGGLKTGEAYLFDIRATNRHVCQLPTFGAKTPAVSLQYLKTPEFSGCSSGVGGPIVAKLSDCALHQKTETEGNYNLVPMPALGPFTSVSSLASANLLVSCRPSPKQSSRISHTFCDFVKTPSGELTCVPVKTVFGGRTQVQLTRSRLFSHPDNASSVLICAGDEDANGALIWDGASGDILSKLQTSSPVLDFAAVKVDQKLFLTALTSSTLEVYGWNPQ